MKASATGGLLPASVGGAPPRPGGVLVTVQVSSTSELRAGLGEYAAALLIGDGRCSVQIVPTDLAAARRLLAGCREMVAHLTPAGALERVE